MLPEQEQKNRFLTDRMLGSLCRYLRFMGYDTVSANSFAYGNHREDTELLSLSREEGRILLTRDRELAARAGRIGILVVSEDVIEQVRQLLELKVIDAELRMTRCSLCNTLLREATLQEIRAADYAPENNGDLLFVFCPSCRKLYWNGTHGRHLAQRMRSQVRNPGS